MLNLCGLFALCSVNTACYHSAVYALSFLKKLQAGVTFPDQVDDMIVKYVDDFQLVQTLYLHQKFTLKVFSTHKWICVKIQIEQTWKNSRVAPSLVQKLHKQRRSTSAKHHTQSCY